MGPAPRSPKSRQRPVPASAARDTPLRENAQPLSAGDEVVVFALSASGRPFLEGRATIVRRCSQPHVYHVAFSGDRITRIRFVNADWQARPDRSLALLLEFYRSNRMTNPAVDDFFPDESNQ